jgi:hypothetical protein
MGDGSLQLFESARLRNVLMKYARILSIGLVATAFGKRVPLKDG